MEKVFICNEDWPVVETKQGKLRGYFFDDVFVFQGIKYADAKRFQMPEPVAPWEGIRDALGFGYNCPGPAQPRFMPRGEVAGPHRFWPESEHCQYLNIWTGSINPGAKKPVLVWLHGGGYVDGSAIEMIAYDGDHLAKYDDVVVVSVNHRLNVLGHLDMSDFGPEYENSGNAGFADLVAALQWVHENIEGFGGDPNNVTAFGQSGGGGKVSALLQIPSAEGLFQKAIVMSGIITDDNVLVHTTADPKMIVAEIMKEMGLEEDELERFISAPEIILERATDRAVKNLNKKGYVVGWGPKPNGWYAGSLCLNTSTAFSKKIPTMVGTAFAEFNRTPSTVDKSKMTEEDILHQTEEKFGEKAGEFLRIFRKAYPYVDEAYAVCTDTFFRIDTMEYVLKKAAESEAPVYNYIFTLGNTLYGGSAAGHCADIPYAFHNADRIPVCQVPGVSDRMNDDFSNMIVTFARTGNPNTERFPKWRPCTGEHIRTMVFGATSVEMEDHDKELVRFITENSKPMEIHFFHGDASSEQWFY